MGTALAVACVALLISSLALWRVILRDREMNQLIEAFHVLSTRMDRLTKFVSDNQLWADPDAIDQEDHPRR